MSLRPFFSYYGSKWRDAPRLYPKPYLDTIIEPFAGSAGFSLRYADRKVILCEIDPIVVQVWRFLIRASAKEILSIPDVDNDGTVDDLRVVQEARWLVGFWLNRAAESPRKAPSKWMREGCSPSSFWGERVRQTIARQVDKIRHWEIFQCDYSAAPNLNATWFIDPPYSVAGRHYRFGSQLIDYQALAHWCRDRPGQAIVCENNGAAWLPFRSLDKVKTTRSKRSHEAVWVSSSSCVEVLS